MRTATASAQRDIGGQDLAEVLRLGPFAPALRAAIAARGLGLDRIRDRLRQHGITISIATLSYWQSGHRHPERPESLRALKVIEGILELPADSLSALLGSSTRRDSRASAERLPEITDLWTDNPNFADLLSDLPTTSDTSLRRLNQRDRVTVGPDGLIRSTLCSQTMRAEQDGVDRCLFAFGYNGRAGRHQPIVTNLRNCEPGRVAGNAAQGLIAGELVFERALRRGETIRIEYQIYSPPDAGDPAQRTESISRCFLRPIPLYLVELCFDGHALPRRCQQFKGRISDGGPTMTRNLEMGIANTVWAVGRNFGPGYFGIHWDRALPDPSSDPVVDWSSHWSCNVI
ncbi:hypothetical protein ACTXG6_30795 [Pseudonocardia sp. Cha107L01]|uniref:hypothetical protein n=1 Tax=Pseudonocardia sp. Cha107L01 TaxID=3457576 RepID=UPI00403E378C